MALTTLPTAFNLVVPTASLPPTIRAVNQFLHSEEIASTAGDKRNWEAERLFLEVFRLGGKSLSVSLGGVFGASPTGFHPDNLAAGRALWYALSDTLGLPPSKISHDNTLLEANLEGDIVLVGGANSTVLTAVAFEYTGRWLRRRRPEDWKPPEVPIIPLAYYGISDESLVTEQVCLNDGTNEPFGSNWPLMGTGFAGGRYQGPLPPRTRPPGKYIDCEGRKLPFVDSDYLLVTRLPNYLAGALLREDDPQHWPFLLVFDGMHGIGTRAVELLLQKDSVPLLNTVRQRLDGTNAFQVLFEVGDISYDDDLTAKGRSITLKDIVPLHHTREQYAEAHQHVKDTLAELARLGYAEDTDICSLSIPKLARSDSRPPAEGGGTASPPPTDGGLTMSRSHVWLRFLSAYRELRALRFASKEDFQAATKLLWSSESSRPPFDLIGEETIIVPVDAIPYFHEQGLNFTSSEVLSARDLPAEKLNRLRREQGLHH